MEKKKLKIGRIVLVIVVFIVIIVLNNFICNILANQTKTDKTRLLFNNEFVSLENDIVIEDSIIYISEEDIKNIFDKTIYYNVGDKELITTYNKHVAVLHLDNNKLLVNDSEMIIEGELNEKNNNIYLPISDMEFVYDIEIDYSENNNLVIIDSTTKAKKKAMVLKNTKLKSGRTIFSTGIEKLKMGDTVYVISDKGRYKKVRTISGKIGYIKNRKLSEIETLREDYENDEKEINILGNYTDINELSYDLKTDNSKDNIIILDAFEVEKDCSISYDENIQSENYKNSLNNLKENEIGIIGKLKNKAVISANFSTYSQRNAIIKSIYEEVIKNEYNGIFIEVEDIDDVNSFYRFIIELVPKFKESGLKIGIKITDQIDKEKVKDIVDFSINNK